MYKHVMLDLETIGTSTKSAIISIGAIAFNLDEQDEYKTLIHSHSRLFSRNIHPDDWTHPGFDINGHTLSWWFDQSDHARAPFRPQKWGEESRLVHVLNNFTAFFVQNGATHVWGNGANFDNPILRNAYETLGPP